LVLFSTYSEALSRDWWRISKAGERIKVVNLGGGAIGTGMAIPRFFIMEVVPALKKLTSLPITQGENLADATCNLDKWVEVHAILKAHAVNLEKMVSDLRHLSSGLMGEKEIELPALQVGSSIMPGKINPVVPEYIISSAHRIYANDQKITSLCGQGCLELNAYLPEIGLAMIGKPEADDFHEPGAGRKGAERLESERGNCQQQVVQKSCGYHSPFPLCLVTTGQPNWPKK
jgi:aspartate ammonia-lyase